MTNEMTCEWSNNWRDGMGGVPCPLDPPGETWDGLDEWIRPIVAVLRHNGVETFQSCEGGDGHSYPEPTVEFHGSQYEGPRAFAAARAHGLPVSELRRVWSVQDGELVGPHWAMTFRRPGLPACVEQPGGNHFWRWGGAAKEQGDGN